MNETRQELEAQLEELQLWFARKPYGWRERATRDQLEQWNARSLEQDRILEALSRMDDEDLPLYW